MKKFLFAAVCTITLVGFVAAEEFGAVIMKVDGNNITYFKTKAGGKGGGKGGKGGGKKDGDEIKGTAAASVKVAKGMYSPDDMKWTVGDPVDGGLKADTFMNIDQEKGTPVRITVADDGPDKVKITQILTVKGFGGKKKADK